MDSNTFRHVDIALEVQINAPRERVFRALTEEYGNWWPHRFKEDSTCYNRAKLGGEVGEKFSNGGGALYGHIAYIDPPHKIVMSRTGALSRGSTGQITETLEDDGNGGTILKRSFLMWGNVPEDAEQMFREGARMMLDQALKPYCEGTKEP